MGPLLALARAEVVAYLSNRRSLLITLAAPILLAAFFGSVLGGPAAKPSRVPIAIVDQDASATSKRIVEAIKGDSTFELVDTTADDMTSLVRRGKVRAAIVFPAGFGDGAARSLFRPNAGKPEIAVHYDPSQSITLSVIRGLLTQHVMKAVSESAFSGAGLPATAQARDDVQKSATLGDEERRNLLSLLDSVERVQRNTGSPREGTSAAQPGFSVPFSTREVEVTSGQDRRYNGYAHAFAGMGVQFVLFMSVDLGIGVLMMKRLGLWRRLRAAPISRATLVGSRILAGTIIAFVLMLGIYAAAIAFFGVRVEGSVVGFLAVLLAFSLFAAIFGLAIAALGRTPEATRGLAILITLLLVMLGGAWIPTFVFPQWLQTATLWVPTRWAIDGLEATTWRGLGLDATLLPIAALLAFSAVLGWVAIRRFRWDDDT
jgi:ABC-2 type transport system permease protein